MQHGRHDGLHWVRALACWAAFLLEVDLLPVHSTAEVSQAECGRPVAAVVVSMKTVAAQSLWACQPPPDQARGLASHSDPTAQAQRTIATLPGVRHLQYLWIVTAPSSETHPAEQTAWCPWEATQGGYGASGRLLGVARTT